MSTGLLRNLTLHLAALTILGAVAIDAQAGVMGMMTVDPGTVGQQSNSPILTYNFGPGSDTIDLVFEDMKHVEATEWGFEIFGLTQIDASNIEPETFQVLVPYVFYLTDEFGEEIPDTRDEGEATGFGLVTKGSNIPIIAHDFHLSFDLDQLFNPDGLNTIENGQVGQGIEVNIFVDGRVGEWAPVPEPGTLALLGLGLAGVGVASRRKQAV